MKHQSWVTSALIAAVFVAALAGILLIAWFAGKLDEPALNRFNKQAHVSCKYLPAPYNGAYECYVTTEDPQYEQDTFPHPRCGSSVKCFRHLKEND